MPSINSTNATLTDSTLDEPRPQTPERSTSPPNDEKVDQLQRRVETLERMIVESSESAEPSSGSSASESRSIHMRSKREWMGLPLYEIAFGPDSSRGSRKSHAKGILAIGDRATGVVAMGGMAQGIVAIGGLSWGLFSVGGCTLGFVAGVGGVAAGGAVLGGVAVGLYAVGGLAISGLPLLSELFSSTSASG